MGVFSEHSARSEMPRRFAIHPIQFSFTRLSTPTSVHPYSQPSFITTAGIKRATHSTQQTQVRQNNIVTRILFYNLYYSAQNCPVWPMLSVTIQGRIKTQLLTPTNFCYVESQAER